MATFDEILKSTRELVEVKRAEFNKSSIAGDDPNSLPGAEHDSTVPDEMKQPDKEVNDGTMGPKSTRSTEGAGDDSPKTRGHALEADQAAETPKKKPAISADANAKEADDGESDSTAKLANEILNDIRAYQKDKGEKKADDSSDAPEEGAEEKSDDKTEASDSKEADDKAEASDDKSDDKAEASDDTSDDKSDDKEADDDAPAKEKSDDGKSAAGGPQLELTTDVLAKIAAMVLATEEGAQFIEGYLAKSAGAEAADETMSFLAEQAELAEKQASEEQGAADAQALILQAAYDKGVKDAGAQQPKAEKTEEKPAESKGVFFKLGQDLAGMAAGGMPPGAGMPPEVGGEEAGGAGIADLMGAGAEEMPEEAGLEGADELGEVSPEELQEALGALVSEGTISAEDAQALLDYIASAGGEEAPAEEAPMEEAPAEEAPVEAPAASEEAGMEAMAEKKSGEQALGSLLDAIRKVRSRS